MTATFKCQKCAAEISAWRFAEAGLCRGCVDALPPLTPPTRPQRVRAALDAVLAEGDTP